MKQTLKKHKALFILLLLGGAGCTLFLGSCSLDYSAAAVDEALNADIPRTVLVDFVHTRVSRGRPQFRMKAARAEVYEEREETRLYDVVFHEYDSQGNILTQGKAQEVLFETTTENAQITGNIVVYSAKEETQLSAEKILWDNESKQLTSGGESLVTLLQNNGTTLKGSGFTGDFTYNTYDFAQPVEGLYRSNDDE